MKKDNIQYIKDRLLASKGYYKNGKLKKGYQWIADKLGVSNHEVVYAVNELRQPSIKMQAPVTYAATIVNREPVTKKVSSAGTYWVTGCAHAPWHNKAMYEATFNYLSKEVSLDGMVLAGDIADLNSLSSHDRGKLPIKGVTLDMEYEGVNKFLDEIQSVQDVNSKYFIYGNHEDRYLRAIRDVDTAKYGNALVGPAEALHLSERGYQVLQDWKNDSVQLGPYLDINHGEFLNVHSAKKTIDTYRKSTMYFHTHRFQIYLEGNVGGWNMGSGADFNAPVFGYATRAMKSSWVNASALVTIDSNGFYHVQPLLFINNQLIINGKKY